MRKPSKSISVILFIMVAFFSFQIISVYQYFSSVRSTLKNNFSIDMPKPKHEIKVMSDIQRMPAEGRAYSVLEYDENNVKKLKDFSKWKLVDKESKKEVNEFVDKFKDCLSVNNEKMESNKYIPQVQEKTLYYFKPNKNDYAILLFNEDEKRIYVLEYIDRFEKYSMSFKN
ncbi:hypothetical protein [Clostridium fungisolvens]|uniref:Uncharacterized protein n=1 Tax=Clostridium fungisolvens TaxID=1604897 RepID=A0A6V8SKT0_9CLOT|nr:hypothetical protein [Clostridium fungisolvens]GFP77376.1 hypothetical protein bsdtw1_03503 [Clostridium fungisolvens]